FLLLSESHAFQVVPPRLCAAAAAAQTLLAWATLVTSLPVKLWTVTNARLMGVNTAPTVSDGGVVALLRPTRLSLVTNEQVGELEPSHGPPTHFWKVRPIVVVALSVTPVP